MACLIGEPYLFLRARARFVCAYAFILVFYDDVEGVPERIRGRALPSVSKTYCTLNARAVCLKTMLYLCRTAR